MFCLIQNILLLFEFVVGFVCFVVCVCVCVCVCFLIVDLLFGRELGSVGTVTYKYLLTF